MAFIQFNGISDEGKIFPVLINSDRIDAIEVGRDGKTVFIFTGGNDNPFAINNTFDEVIYKLNAHGYDAQFNSNEFTNASNNLKYKQFVDSVDKFKEIMNIGR